MKKVIKPAFTILSVINNLCISQHWWQYIKILTLQSSACSVCTITHTPKWCSGSPRYHLSYFWFTLLIKINCNLCYLFVCLFVFEQERNNECGIGLKLSPCRDANGERSTVSLICKTCYLWTFYWCMMFERKQTAESILQVSCSLGGNWEEYTNCYLLCRRAEKGRSVTCILSVVNESNFLDVSQSLCRSLTVRQHYNNVISSETQSRYSNNYGDNIKLIWYGKKRSKIF